jgi:LuxR family transcriptional regulator
MLARSEGHFFSLLDEIAKRLGFEYYAFGMRLPLPVTNPKLLLHSNCPAAWQWPAQNAASDSTRITVDPKRYRNESLAWSIDFPTDRPLLWKDAHRYGLTRGWDQPCHGPMGISSALSLATSDPRISVEELDDLSPRLTWLTHTAHHGLASLMAPKYLPETQTDFSHREIDILRLTADGKTAGAIGRIMHLSERTVNFHMAKILQKLATANKTAAVLKAAMLGLL